MLNDKMRTLIINNDSTIDIRNEALNSGYLPLIVDGVNRILDGTTNLEELNNKLAIY